MALHKTQFTAATGANPGTSGGAAGSPIATTAATSRVACAALESVLTNRVFLQKVQQAIAEVTLPSRKVPIADLQAALAAVLS